MLLKSMPTSTNYWLGDYDYKLLQKAAANVF